MPAVFKKTLWNYICVGAEGFLADKTLKYEYMELVMDVVGGLPIDMTLIGSPDNWVGNYPGG